MRERHGAKRSIRNLTNLRNQTANKLNTIKFASVAQSVERVLSRARMRERHGAKRSIRNLTNLRNQTANKLNTTIFASVAQSVERVIRNH